MNQIEIRELSDKLLYDNTVILNYSIQYPQIINSRYSFGQRIFNMYNQKIAFDLQKYIKTELFNDAKSVYEYNKANGFPLMVYEVILKYNITRNNNYIVSLYSDEYMYTGGAHGSTIRKGQTWDLRNGRMLPLQYFYPNDSYYLINILKSINFQIKQQIEQEGEGIYFDNYCELILETFKLENFYVFNNFAEVFFQQYDIAPYSSGIPTFKISFWEYKCKNKTQKCNCISAFC